MSMWPSSLCKTLIPRGTVSPATCWDLFLTVLLLWCGCQHEQPSPSGIQRVCCPVCLLPDTRCCHGYLRIQGNVLGKQVLFQGTAILQTSHSPPVLVVGSFENYPLTISHGIFHIVFSWSGIQQHKGSYEQKWQCSCLKKVCWIGNKMALFQGMR